MKNGLYNKSCSFLLIFLSFLSFSLTAIADENLPYANNYGGVVSAEETEDIYAGEFLTVEQDGTLSLDPEYLQMIPDDQIELWMDQFTELNQSIIDGKISPFTKKDKRLFAKAVVKKDHSSSKMYFSIGCFCSKRCCIKSTKQCCASGFGPLCWKVKTCKP